MFYGCLGGGGGGGVNIAFIIFLCFLLCHNLNGNGDDGMGREMYSIQ